MIWVGHILLNNVSSLSNVLHLQETDLVLAVVSAPAPAVVAATVSSESAVVAIATLLLVASRVLVAQTAETAILAVAKVVRVVTVALLRVLGSALSRSALVGGTGATGLSTKSRWAGSTALVVVGGLEGVIVQTLAT